MRDPIVYRSTHPDVLAHWDKTASAEARKAWRARVDAVLADLGFAGRHPVVTDTILGTVVTGVEHREGGPFPAGWRAHRSMDGAITPHKGTKVGKAAAEDLGKLALPNPRKDLPGGMPHIADAASEAAMLRPAIQRFGDVVYVRWSQQISDRDTDQIDGAVWDRAALSEYYAALEAEEANT